MTMARYDWKNSETGEIVETDQPSTPPDDRPGWGRYYGSTRLSFGRVAGAGGSPAKSAYAPKPKNQ